MPVWSVEGIPGVGKSTVLARLKDVKAIGGYPVVVLDEPIDEWNTVVDANNFTLFELYYNNPAAHAFAFQMLVLVTRANLLKQALKRHPDAYIFTERCPASDRLFAKLLYENGSITQEQYTIYDKAWKLLNDVPVSGVVYMRADAAFALERCLSRGREGEQLSLEYLEKCGQLHETWIQSIPCRCLFLDPSMTTPTAVTSIVRFVKPQEEVFFILDLVVLLWGMCLFVVGFWLYFY
jgi:deoxyadenosine/deoxycytidine kinase